MFSFGKLENIIISQEDSNKNKIESGIKNLERVNSYIESTQDPDLKKTLIVKADMLNSELAELEICCGLNEDEIMEEYKKISKHPQNASQVVELAIKANPEIFSGAKNFSGVLDALGGALKESKITATVVAAFVILMATDGKAQAYENIINFASQNNEIVLSGENSREEALADSILGSKIGETSKERIREGNLKKIKIIGKKIVSRQPARVVMSSREGFPEDVSLILSKLRSSGDYLNKDFIELLSENAENFAPGELEKIERYLIDRFEK